jgi:hypothetical protein
VLDDDLLDSRKVWTNMRAFQREVRKLAAMFHKVLSMHECGVLDKVQLMGGGGSLKLRLMDDWPRTTGTKTKQSIVERTDVFYQ